MIRSIILIAILVLSAVSSTKAAPVYSDAQDALEKLIKVDLSKLSDDDQQLLKSAIEKVKWIITNSTTPSNFSPVYYGSNEQCLKDANTTTWLFAGSGFAPTLSCEWAGQNLVWVINGAGYSHRLTGSYKMN